MDRCLMECGCGSSLSSSPSRTSLTPRSGALAIASLPLASGCLAQREALAGAQRVEGSGFGVLTPGLPPSGEHLPTSLLCFWTLSRAPSSGFGLGAKCPGRFYSTLNCGFSTLWLYLGNFFFHFQVPSLSESSAFCWDHDLRDVP